MSHNIGKNIDDSRTNWVRSELLIESTVLPSGNIENNYRFRNSCQYYFEIEPESRIIVGWRDEGREADCEIAP